MTQVYFQLLNGLVVGSSLALVASGLALQFGVMDIINFAQGDFYMLGGYALWLLLAHTNYAVALVVGTVLVGIVGGGVLMIMMRPLLEHAEVMVLLATLGLSLVMEQAATDVWGGSTQLITPPFSGSVQIGPIRYPIFDLFIVLAAIIVLAASFVALQYTKYGIWLRGVAQNRSMAAALGVPVNRVFVVALMVSIALAALAGGLLVPITSVYPTVGGDVILNAFIIVVAGGLGNFKGAAIIAFLLGEVESVGSIWINPAGVQIALFALVILILIGRSRAMQRTVLRI